MKKQNYFTLCIAGIFCLAFFNSPTCSAGEVNFMEPAQQGFAQAEKELNQAARKFEKEADQVARGMQQNGQTSWSQAASATSETQPQASSQSDPRAQALQGSPETGYAGTWTDPQTGDVITSVIAPKPPVQNSQNYPVIIEPQIGNYNAGSGQSPYTGWSNWQTSPDNPGYPPQQSVPYNQPPPPGWHSYYPGQPYPGFNPYPYPYPQPYPGYEHGSWNTPPAFVPGMPGSQPPPFNPNYRPLRPGQNQGSIWQPGMTPPVSGWQPPSNWNPPATSQPAQPSPSMPQLPMQPAGQTWNRPGAPSQGGFFGNPGAIRRGNN